jgi:hypothetical protein
MNVLILSPERVGGNLLQRLLAVYMSHLGLDRPVINTHNIAHGLKKVYNSLLQQEIVVRSDDKTTQSLSEILELLSQADHYKVSMLGHRKMVQRGDHRADQLAFYEYLNNNFFIIACSRANVFENALSWCIQSHSKIYNIWSPGEKVRLDQTLTDSLEIDRNTLYSYLDRYSQYEDWVRDYFNVQSFWEYDLYYDNIEEYILKLPFMNSSPTWLDMFGLTFEEFNVYHRLLSEICGRTEADAQHTRLWHLNLDRITHQNWNQAKGPSWPSVWQEYDPDSVDPTIGSEISQIFKFQNFFVDSKELTFLKKFSSSYKKAISDIFHLSDRGVILDSIPVKLHTLNDKIRIVKNFDQCLQWYNHWCEQHKHQSYDQNQIAHDADIERKNYQSIIERARLPQ